jgi:hypothetical protein
MQNMKNAYCVTSAVDPLLKAESHAKVITYVCVPCVLLKTFRSSVRHNHTLIHPVGKFLANTKLGECSVII